MKQLLKRYFYVAGWLFWFLLLLAAYKAFTHSDNENQNKSCVNLGGHVVDSDKCALFSNGEVLFLTIPR